MNKKIFQTVFFSILLTLVLVLAVSLSVLYTAYEDRIESDLSSELMFLASSFENGNADMTSVTVPGHRVTIIAKDGSVLYDSDGEADEMENHLERPEIQEALIYGYGEDTRESETLMENLHYAAKVLSDGTILRIAVPAETLFSFARLILSILRTLRDMRSFRLFSSGYRSSSRRSGSRSRAPSAQEGSSAS